MNMVQNPGTPVSYFRLLDLPLELRQQVLEQHILDHYCQPRGVAHEEKIENDSQLNYVSLLLVNKQISQEIADIARRQRTFTIGFPSQPTLVDIWAKYCFRCHDQGPDYGSMMHFIIEINLDECDTKCLIFSKLLALCSEYRSLQYLGQLSIVFLNTDWADEWLQREKIKYVLWRLLSLDNITKATIELPSSFSADDHLLKLCRGAEDVIMGIKPHDQGSAYENVKAILDSLWP